MATNLALDPDLLDRALAVSGQKTKKAAVTKALEEFIARREQREILDLFGKLDWDLDYPARFLQRLIGPAVSQRVDDIVVKALQDVSVHLAEFWQKMAHSA